VVERARALARLSRAPAEHVAREQARLHQELRELRAAGRRRVLHERELLARAILVLGRKAAAADAERGRGEAGLPAAASGLERAARGAGERRRRDLDRLRLAIEGHDPERALARGWSIVEDEAGAVVTSAAAARAAGAVHLRFRDGRVRARVEDEEAR
jgi:exodeoxyribonuclease VII large subunit